MQETLLRKLNKMKVPFVDLHRQYLSIKDQIDQAIADTITKTAFIGGESIKAFEKAFASFIGTEYCIACANGTDSLEILLKSMGVGRGDEVIVPAISWISTSEAVSSVGAKPVFVDIDPDFYSIDVSKIEERITENTKCIIPVHLYGHPADMESIMALANKHNLKVLEDCAQAHGATFNGKKIGTFGHAASFSFYPGKNLGAYGDAGGMVTNDPEIAKTARMIANHGQLKKHDHQIEGRNSRMDGLQASILNIKLPHLDTWTQKRQEVAKAYTQKLEGVSEIVLPKIHEKASHVFHLYVIRTEDRDGLMSLLKENGISSGVHYPTPLPLLPAYKHLGHTANDFPVASEYANKILSLPIFPELQQEEIEYVCNNIIK